MYYSTNHRISGQKNRLTFREALMSGIAVDQGLLMPQKIPQVDFSRLKALKNSPYHETATYLLHLFLSEDISREALSEITREAYANGAGWGEALTIPLENAGENSYIARLDQGPTASFKDFAAQWMARMMCYFKKKDETLTILVATSGDTGSAVGAAFEGLEGFRVCILFPKEEVSLVQKKQLTSFGQNVRAIELQGKFDDCQRLVKDAFSDSALSELNLVSANSINIGRLFPQMVYYFYLYLQVCEPGDPVIFSVPSGNLGNSLGCEIARRMGLPVEKLLIATNANNAFPRFLKEGHYQKIEPSLNCLSNAMNVGNPSNLARYFELYGGTVDKEGKVHLQPDLDEMKNFLKAYDFSDAEGIYAIREVYQKYALLLEPHGVMAWLALQKYRREFPVSASTKAICIETAHPAKFSEVLEEQLHLSPQATPALEKMNQRANHSYSLPVNRDKFRDFLLNWK